LIVSLTLPRLYGFVTVGCFCLSPESVSSDGRTLSLRCKGAPFCIKCPPPSVLTLSPPGSGCSLEKYFFRRNLSLKSKIGHSLFPVCLFPLCPNTSFFSDPRPLTAHHFALFFGGILSYVSLRPIENAYTSSSFGSSEVARGTRSESNFHAQFLFQWLPLGEAVEFSRKSYFDSECGAGFSSVFFCGFCLISKSGPSAFFPVFFPH